MVAITNMLDYQITEQIYAGSRTLVYRGIRQRDGAASSKDYRQSVVIKILRNQYPTFSELVQFRNQYTIAKNLNQPGIIQTYSLESYQNGYALVMEDFGGISLKEWISKKENPLSLIEFLILAIAISETLDILYQERIIHKDIKPNNILINPQTKQVKLIDFSIASLLPRETQTLINPNVLEGTLAYISPEQTGRMNRGIDYRTDFYSLGVTFYELLTGKLPCESNDPMELVHCHIAKAVPSVQEINAEIPLVISEIVSKLMAKNVEDRYQSALGLKADLEKCLLQLQETGKIEGFKIGQKDLCDRFLIPEKLYGREQEVQQLLEAFERVASPQEIRVAQGNSEMILVAGFSGIGKTVVVNEVHKPIVRQHGYFIKGKFDQFNRNIPFSAFVQAFRDLMEQLLSETDAQIQAWKSKILAALGENGQVIIEVIPELERIIGQQPPTQELSGVAAQNLFNLLFQKFISVFTTKEHPLVIFLDDLQWADSASLKLMQLLISESQSNHLLLIGAYRDNEVSATHPLMLTLDEIGKAGATVNTMTLAPLAINSVNQLVAETLTCSANVAQPLTELVYQKTKGNPFFATQFLRALHQEGLIAFNPPNSPLSKGGSQGGWQCDISKVRAAALTDDVVEFMAQQLQKLPIATQSVLKLAACIGNQFDLATLAIVSQNSEIETATALWKTLQEGFILPQSEVYKFYVGEEEKIDRTTSPTVSYRFLHDRVQQAAYSLIPESDRAIVHYQIGQLLLQQISPEAREERIFELVNQLNYGTPLVVEQTERDELARLNLTACRKARAATAYQAAREYASVGLQLLGTDAWQQQYEMTLALHELAAEVTMLNGDFEAVEQFVDLVIQQTRFLSEKVNVYCIRIQSQISQGKFAFAIAIGQQVLQQLGITFPETPTPSDLQQDIQEIEELIGNREIADLVHLPEMTDAEKLGALKIVNFIIPAAYLSGSALYPLLNSLSVKLSIQYGNTSTSALGYATYGSILCNFLQAVDTGSQFGSLGLQIISKLDAKASKTDVLMILGIFIVHRKSHIKETLPLLQEGYTVALEFGNLVLAGYNGHTFCLNSFWCNQPLATLEQNISAYCHSLMQLNQLTTANYCRIYWQAVLNLLGVTEHPTILSGKALEEKEFLLQLQSTNDGYGLYIFYLYKLMLCFLFGEIEPAKNHAIEVRRYFMAGAGLVSEAVFYLYDSLRILAQLNPQLNETSAALQVVTENQTQLQHWAHHAPMNYQHKFDLVEAEKCRILGQKTAAIELYDRAIALAKTNEYTQEEALANELAAKFYLDWGKEKIAQTYMQEAYYGYARWGAKAKINDLEKRYPQLLQPILQQQQFSINPLESIANLTLSQNTATYSSSSSSISNALDFASLLKAAQAISSSIELDELMASLTRILLQNSGAKKSVLILLQNGTLQVRAITCVHHQENSVDIQTVLESQPIDTSQDVPLKIIQYVKNTQKTVIIDRLETDIPGLIGDYLLIHKPQSLCCTPIVDRGNLVGIIYLENKLTNGVFTSDRLQIIHLLSSQAAISLENALLYQQAQQALADLQQAQLQIVQSEKMSALGNLVAGVAHEINNPVGFISGNINEAIAAVKDITEYLQLYQEKFPNPGEEITEKAEEIEIEYLLEDLPKMLDSMQVGCDRIKDISTSLRTFSRADKDYKVPFNLHEGIDSTLLILKHRLKANEHRSAIEVVKEYGDLPPIECFPGQLNQVFMNIIANAIDALEESNVKHNFEQSKNQSNSITIRTKMKSQEWVEICIFDNGLGIQDEIKEKIFDHLFTTKGVGKGTGLGLAIAKSIVVEKHGGSIEVNSTPEQGTEFTIVLPTKARQNS
ncbi:AAA family ATPase [Phormidium sp. LEGE 05292]|uniref:trifunctional serine/threonine-protein kinase/ATP-binding protein/sensor histidine kinase n=1 Tax=[Phormidium] sp. LEGE 05292 TaxID=767427 RepID=UPI00187F7B2F|nr:ATP-binding sensor histidine kinase [Phormidium sp. LEGE 05292]MBE9228048.1 AAA family ATPase [Phormidium sp. LEGE 05292]